MKKLLALLTVFVLLCPAACAESVQQILRLNLIYAAMNDALDKEELQYTKDEEYHCSYFAIELEESQLLGNADVILYAFEDGVDIVTSYEQAVPEAKVDEMMRLCNHLSASIYVGKFYVDPTDHYLCYEVYLPMSATDMNDYDKSSIGEYVWFTASMLDYYYEYFEELIVNGETADNVYAMWVADSE